jgi:hypothetical protein
MLHAIVKMFLFNSQTNVVDVCNVCLTKCFTKKLRLAELFVYMCLKEIR